MLYCVWNVLKEYRDRRSLLYSFLQLCGGRPRFGSLDVLHGVDQGQERFSSCKQCSRDTKIKS